MTAMHDVFISESRELVAQATDDLIAIEREGFSTERVDRVFRAFHTLKGSAGLVALPAMGLTLHAAEDLVAAIHAERLPASAAVIDQALACLDLVSQWVDAFEADGMLPPQSEGDARAMTDRLRNLLSGQAIQEENKAKGSGDGTLPDWVAGLPETERDAIADALRGESALFAISYEPLADCFFNGDDPIDLMRRVPNLIAFRIEGPQSWPPLAAFDPYECRLRLHGIAAGPYAALQTIFRFMPDQVRIMEIPAAALPVLSEKAGEDDVAVLVRAVIEEQKRVLALSNRGEDLAGRMGAVARVAANALRHDRKFDLAERIERAGGAATAAGDPAPLLAALYETLAALMPHSAAAEEPGDTEGLASGADKAERVVTRLLRVDESKVDALFNLAAELIVAKNSIAHLATQAEIAPQDLVRMLRRAHESIDRVAGDMHSAILQLRMVPIAQVFRSFPRLVRDMSQSLKKKVKLVTTGEATECDKTIADRLSEPLLHLLRNAVDHGIEDPDARRAAGKPETATITLQASRLGDRLVVAVSDDGRGIDPQVVRRKAGEGGLLTIDELNAMPDEEVVNLIFAAGFSTAAEISEISGRGVGMDVVRTTIEQIGGRVLVASRVGAGTTVRLDLPMNIAMSQIMVVEAGGQVFGLPMESVSETLRLPPDRITQIKSNDGFVLRDRIVPICALAELMNLPSRKAADVRLFVVTEIGGKLTALEIDAIRDRIEVVLKPMQGLLAKARGYAGTTLLGNGNVLLVLNLKEILDLKEIGR